ncbi:MAG: acyl-CoA desaturase, partial [Cyanobacteria bacterium J06642_11]
RTYESGDYSTNCWWVALVTYGEGWHNNHHAFQFSARHGLKWWEIDITWMTINVLSKLGLATKVKLPKPRDMQSALLSS